MRWLLLLLLLLLLLVVVLLLLEQHILTDAHAPFLAAPLMPWSCTSAGRPSARQTCCEALGTSWLSGEPALPAMRAHS